MTDDLTTRLRDGSVNYAEMRMAADRIETLEANLSRVQGHLSHMSSEWADLPAVGRVAPDQETLDALGETLGRKRCLEWVRKFPDAYPEGDDTDPAYWIRMARRDLRIAAHHFQEAGVLGVPADEWADYFERWGSTVGSPPFTQEAVVAALRGPVPFGKAAGA